MKETVFLEYCFLFEPASTWTNMYQFEGDLLKFFNEHGMDAVAIKTVSGYNGRRIIQVCKKEEVAVSEPVVIPKLTPQQQKEKLMKPSKQVKREKTGKYA